MKRNFLQLSLLLIVGFCAAIGVNATKAQNAQKGRKSTKKAPKVYPPPMQSQFQQVAFPDNLPESSVKKAQAVVRSVVRGREDLTANKSAFDFYFKSYYVRKMTQVRYLGELTDDRLNLWKEFLSVAQGPVHDELNNLLFGMFQSVAKNNYHPAVRYNAMLVIGNLNQVEAARNDPVPPVPFSPALDFMITEFKNPDQIHAVRLAALLGMLRHCEADRVRGQLVNANQKVEIINLCLAELKRDKPPGGLSESGLIWMQRRALDVLSAIGAEPAQVPVMAEVEKILANQDAPLPLRLSAAESLGRFNFRHQGTRNKVKVAEVANQLGVLLINTCQEEINRVADAKKKAEEAKALQSQGGPEGGAGGPNEAGGGMMEMMMSAGDDDTSGQKKSSGTQPLSPAEQIDVNNSKLRVRSRLVSIRLGIGDTSSGLLPIANADEKKKLEDMAKSLDNIANVFEGILPDPKANEGRTKAPDRDVMMTALGGEIAKIAKLLPAGMVKEKADGPKEKQEINLFNSAPKKAAPKAGQPKAGQPKAGQPKAGQPKAGQPKAGQPKAGQAKGAAGGA